MVERLRDRVRRLLREQPSTEIYFTDAIREDSYFQSPRDGRPALFLHSSHRRLVEELHRSSDSP